jgi:hypothetical protein
MNRKTETGLTDTLHCPTFANLFRFNGNTKTMKNYKPQGCVTIHMLPLRHVWNDPMPMIYLALFTWLATVKEGRRVLTQFASKADPIFAQWNYIAYVVLLPVNKIVSHLMDISVMAGIVTYKAKKSNPTKYHRYRLVLYYYITKRYIQALTDLSPKREQRQETSGDIIGIDIVRMEGVTAVLMNLPKEFQRWNKFYGNKIVQQIQPTVEKEKTGEKIKRPFDVTMKLPQCFQQVIAKGKEVYSLDLGKSWDPYVIACRFQENKYDINVTDFFAEPPALYKNGVSLATDGSNEMNSPKKRGPDTDPTDSPKRQKATPTKNQKDACPTKNQPVPEENSIKLDVKNIIINNVKAQKLTTTAITVKIVEVLNGIARDILQHVDGTAVAEGTKLIEKADLV